VPSTVLLWIRHENRKSASAISMNPADRQPGEPPPRRTGTYNNMGDDHQGGAGEKDCDRENHWFKQHFVTAEVLRAWNRLEPANWNRIVAGIRR
jgi:hypothetical protein